MVLSKSILNLPSTADVNVTIKRYDTSTFVERGVGKVTNRGQVTVEQASYTVPSASDLESPTVVIVTKTVNPAGNEGLGATSYSIRIRTWEKVTSDLTDAVIYNPVDAVVALNVQGTEGMPAVADMMKLISAAYGLFFDLSGSPAAPGTAVLTRLAQGGQAL